jgi:hypothetical protein
MKTAALKTVGRAGMERLLGQGPGPVRALVASMVTGTAAAVATYKLLRSGDSDGDED